jgi:hypothetical protein
MFFRAREPCAKDVLLLTYGVTVVMRVQLSKAGSWTHRLPLVSREFGVFLGDWLAVEHCYSILWTLNTTCTRRKPSLRCPYAAAYPYIHVVGMTRRVTTPAVRSPWTVAPGRVGPAIAEGVLAGSYCWPHTSMIYSQSIWSHEPVSRTSLLP